MSLAEKLSHERRARLAAERLLQQKQAELSEANKKLALHARALSHEIVETREVAETLKDINAEVTHDLALANERAVQLERRLLDALTAIRDGFAIYDADDRLVMANAAFLAPFEGMECIVPGTPYSEILAIAVEEGIIDPAPFSPEDWRFDMLARRVAADGTHVVLRLWTGHRIEIVDQRTSDGGIVSIAHDITQTIRREEAVKAARRRAEAANRAKSAFLANMSHELRTPMNGVVGMAELLAESGLSDEQRLYADTIRSSGEALLVLINDVLDYSKIEAEKLSLMPREFDLERTLHEVVMLLQPSAEEKGIEILVDYDVFLETRLVGDPGRIRQILMNLIGNAVKFTLDGHVKINVIGVPARAPTDRRIHVTVEDTGIGIAPDQLDRVFAQFVQVEDERNRAFEGTGLGLSITKQLVELMGGEIWVESTFGEGTCFGFHVTLPLAEGFEITTLAIPPGIAHVIVADEHDQSRDILVRQLSAQGLRVESFDTGAAAAKVIRAGADVIFASDTLPDLDGFALARRLRDTGTTAPIFLMAQNPAGYADHAERHHVSGVLQRPILRRELFDAIAGLAATVTGAEAAPVTGHETEARVLRVLAAEDNRTNRLVFSKMVKTFNITLEFAANGKEAVEMFESFAPDIIFMDISMPLMDGKQATRAIREIEAREGRTRTPVIAMTAHAMAGDDRAILQAGLDKYMTKPLKKADLLQAILEYLPEGIQPPDPPDG